MAPRVDLTGKRYGRLVVMGLHSKTARNIYIWECRCDCGSLVHASVSNLNSGNSTSCGCRRVDSLVATFTTHGMSHTSEYKIWQLMRNRCNNPDDSAFQHYGGRGIAVCNRWQDSFEAFYADMGLRPTGEHTLERREVNGNYEPSNCYWATWDVQANNKRNSVRVQLGEQQCTVNQISETNNLSRSTVWSRVRRGVTPEELVKPAQGAKSYAHSGRSLTLKEWAAEAGISYRTLHRRVCEQNIPIGLALTMKRENDEL